MLKNCLNAETLTAYANGQIAHHQRVDIERHLEDCGECCVLLSQIVDQNVTLLGVAEESTQVLTSVSQHYTPGHPGYIYFSGQSGSSKSTVLPSAIGRYKIAKMIGSGGFGTVYLATDALLERNVAIKVPHAELPIHRKQLDLIQEEAKTVAHLDHPNIVPIYDVGSSKEFPVYLVTKLIEGENLSERQSRGVTEAEAVEWCIQIAYALAYAHSKGIIHRDIKPHNILVDAQGHVCLTDFGLAWRTDGESSHHPSAGTPAYMSSEQRSGSQAIDNRSDIFSLGRVLTELLLASLGNANSLAGESDALIQLRSAGRNDLADICQKACEEKASQRYASAEEFAAALLDYSTERGWHISQQGSKSSLRLLAPSPSRYKRGSMVRWGLLATAFMLGIGFTFWKMGARAKQEQTNIARFLSSPSQATLSDLHDLSQKGFEQLWDASKSDDLRKQLPAKMFLLTRQPETAHEVIPIILVADFDLAQILISAFQEHESTIKQAGLSILNDANRSVQCRLRVAALLAEGYPEDALWNDSVNCTAVKRAWIEAEPEIRESYLHALRYIRIPFTENMRSSIRNFPDRDCAEARQILSAWEHFAEGDLSLQIACLVECPVSLAKERLEILKAKDGCKELLWSIIRGTDTDGTALAQEYPSIVHHYRAQCVAAYCMLQMGEPDAFWDLACHHESPDREIRFAHFCDESNDTLMLLAERLLTSDLLNPVTQSPHKADELLFSPKLSVRRKVLQALFRTNRWVQLQREPFDKIITKLQTLVIEDADPGIQAMASRVLRGITPVPSWHEKPWISRDAVLSSKSDRSWSLNSIDMVMVHIEQPKSCGYSFCLGQSEVSVQSFEQFFKESGSLRIKPDSPTPDDGSSPLIYPQIFVSWYDCAAFCNWLSEREGLDACYSPNANDEYAEGMTIKPNAIQLNGYRLPTSQEWEIGCRAGATTRYATGDHLVVGYGWLSNITSTLQKSSILPPNDFGLFDMHGNASEWILDDPKQERLDTPIDDRTLRQVRGGDFECDASRSTCSHFELRSVCERLHSCGFRIARTLTNLR